VTEPHAATDSLTDVPGILVGHHQRVGDGWLTGTTAVIAPGGAVAGVDVRGGGPGTRETEALRPENLVQHVHAVCLTGGSAYGLAAASGVMDWLAERELGFPVGLEPHEIVPIVPAAVIFDLGRGGEFHNHPDASFGRGASEQASTAPVSSGVVGAGTGAFAGGLKGGVGSASTTLDDGTVVAALAVVNAGGNVIDPATGLPHVHADELGLRPPDAADVERLRAHLTEIGRPLNTTIGVVATSALLTKAECTKLAQVAQDGLARAVQPAHSMFDGDTIFGLATGHGPLLLEGEDELFRSPSGRAAAVNRLLVAAARCFSLATVRAVVAATAAGGAPAYRDLCPSAFVR
jgi:L-aminopeptidase/D-esterase-like protein